MDLELAGKTVDAITFEYGITVQVQGGTLLTLESPFTITSGDGLSVMVDPQGAEHSSDILRALHDEIVSAEFEEAGTLRLVMKRSTWFAEPDANYESWSIRRRGTPSRVHCGPGQSNVAIWD